MTIQRTFMYLSRLAVAATAFAVFSPMAAHAQYSSPIHDVDNGARQPVQFNFGVAGSTSSVSVSGNAYQVPAGKRLVIETITGKIIPASNGGAGVQSVDASIFVTQGGASTQHFLPFNPFNPSGYIMALPVRFYADAGTSVAFFLSRTDPSGQPPVGAWGGTLSVSGYLVNLP